MITDEIRAERAAALAMSFRATKQYPIWFSLTVSDEGYDAPGNERFVVLDRRLSYETSRRTEAYIELSLPLTAEAVTSVVTEMLALEEPRP